MARCATCKVGLFRMIHPKIAWKSQRSRTNANDHPILGHNNIWMFQQSLGTDGIEVPVTQADVSENQGFDTRLASESTSFNRGAVMSGLCAVSIAVIEGGIVIQHCGVPQRLSAFDKVLCPTNKCSTWSWVEACTIPQVATFVIPLHALATFQLLSHGERQIGTLGTHAINFHGRLCSPPSILHMAPCVSREWLSIGVGHLPAIPQIGQGSKICMQPQSSNGLESSPCRVQPIFQTWWTPDLNRSLSAQKGHCGQQPRRPNTWSHACGR